MTPAPGGSTADATAEATALAALATLDALDTLWAQVQREPWAHDFFALMRQVDALRAHAPRTGQAQRPSQEALRLAQAPELDFAPAPLARLELRPGAPPRLHQRFFGLLGPQGAMPLHITEYVRERLHQHGDGAAAHFLDIFHHRMLSLFYRAWAEGQPVVQADRPASDRYLAWLCGLAGLPHAPAALPQRALAFHAGLLAARSRHAEGLCKVLGAYFGVGVAVLANVGQWLPLGGPQHARLGRAAAVTFNRAMQWQVPSAQLGHSALAGSRVFNQQARFGLVLGPLSRPQFDAFLPGGSAWPALLAWVPLLAGPELNWDLRLTLRTDARLPACLSPQRALRPRLGVAAWLGRGTPRGGLRLRPATSFLAIQN